VAYCSRQFNSAESKYSVTELELLTLLFATKQFRCYLYGRKFTVHTDHRALEWLLDLQDPSSRLTRWAVKLGEYDFIVQHRPKTQMRHANALSCCVNAVEETVVLGPEIIRDKQQSDKLCEQYRHTKIFGQMIRGILYRRTHDKFSRALILKYRLLPYSDNTTTRPLPHIKE